MKDKLLLIYFLVTAPIIAYLAYGVLASEKTIAEMIACRIHPEKFVLYHTKLVSGPWKPLLEAGINSIKFNIAEKLAPKAEEIKKQVHKSVAKYRNDTKSLLLVRLESDMAMEIGICPDHDKERCKYRRVLKNKRCGDEYQIIEVIPSTISLSDKEMPTNIVKGY